MTLTAWLLLHDRLLSWLNFAVGVILTSVTIYFIYCVVMLIMYLFDPQITTTNLV